MRRRATTTALPATEARWLAIGAQRLGRARPSATVTKRHIRDTVEALGVLQLDAISVVARTQLLVLFSRLGALRPGLLLQLAGPHGALFEYWGHAASLMPVTHQPLLRWRMADSGPHPGPTASARRHAWRERHADYLAAILEEVRERGPLTAAQLSDPRRQQGEWWDRRSLGRSALEALFADGRLAAWRTATFEKVYDVPERVLPADVLATPTPQPDEAQRRLLLVAARALGVATLRDLAGYHMLKPAVARTRVAELVEHGELVPVAVEGWADEAYAVPDAAPRRPLRSHATLLSPFDSLIWDRERTRRMFGFDYRIEVYVPAQERRHGYYVLPLLLGDRLVARLDLKGDRTVSTLRVAACHLEQGHDPHVVAEAAAVELDALRQWLGLDGIAVAPRGDLHRPLGAAVEAHGSA